MRFEGPAIVTEFDSTTVVLPGYAAEVDANFNILINPTAERRTMTTTADELRIAEIPTDVRSTRSRSTSSRAR